MDFRHILLSLLYLIFLNSAVFSEKDADLSIVCVQARNYLKLQIRGKVVTFSNINFDKCGSDTNLLEIFAEERVIIDEHLLLTGREMQVVIIAPIWEIIASSGSREINLDGKRARDINEPSKNGNENGDKHGVDGRAGFPGGPAGSFYGVANEIVNEGQLLISVKGGDGGSGQTGGRGANGRDGKSVPSEHAFDCGTRTAIGFKFTTDSIFMHNKKVTTYTLHGEEGECGGRGGNGGAGGLGGYAGRIVLINFSNINGTTSSAIVERNGQPGLDGMFQYGGKGGIHGQTLTMYCSNLENRLLYSFVNRNRRNGRNGLTGKSLKMRETPRKPHFIQHFPQAINEYNVYARSKFSQNENSNELLSFYNSINSREEITKHYNTITLIEEFTELELEYFTSKDKDYVVSSYFKLENRFNNFLNLTHNRGKTFDVYKNIIDDLTILISSRTKDLKNSKGHSVMTQVTNRFITDALKPLNETVEQQNVYDRLQALNNRAIHIDDLIEEAQNLINNDLQNAMKNLQNSLDNNVNRLLEEITEIIANTNRVESDLITKREELKQKMYLKGVLDVFKICCGVAAVIYPSLGIATSVGSSLLTTAESSLPKIDVYSEINTIAETEKEISKVSNQFLEGLEPSQQEDFLNNQIEAMTVNMSVGGKSVVEIMKDEIIKKFLKKGKEEELKNNKVSEWAQTYADKITKELKEAENKNDETKINDCKVQLNVLKFLKVSNVVMSGASKPLQNVMQDKKKLDEIDNALSSNKENLAKLYLIEEGLYTQTQPMLRNMFNDISQVGKNMNHMTFSQIVIANWKIRSTLDKVQDTLKSTISNFEVSDEINWTLTKLLSTFDVIKELNDKVSEYEDKKADVTFIAVMHMPQVSNMLAVDHQLACSVSKLKKIYYENELKDKYMKWIYAFKQFSFPRGGYFLSETRWLESMVDESVDQVNRKIKRNIEIFKDIYDTQEEREKLLQNTEEDFFRGSTSLDEKAFFIWKNETSYQLISDILSGKQTTLIARDLTNSFSALKFTYVGIIFTPRVATIETNLTAALTNIRVRLNHHGDSVYTFANTSFIIKTNPVLLTYKFYTEDNKVFSVPSMKHNELSRGEYMLSPFATWTVKLEGTRRKFNLLQEFIGKVDIELVGKGQYSTEEECDQICQATLMKTYTYYKDT